MSSCLTSNRTVPNLVRGTQSISTFFYRVLLRHLGYAAEDFDLAELEISLENEGKLEEFIQRYDDRYAALDKGRERLLVAARTNQYTGLESCWRHTS